MEALWNQLRNLRKAISLISWNYVWTIVVPRYFGVVYKTSIMSTNEKLVLYGFVGKSDRINWNCMLKRRTDTCIYVACQVCLNQPMGEFARASGRVNYKSIIVHLIWNNQNIMLRSLRSLALYFWLFHIKWTIIYT
jgi:hypothetical protein